METDFLKNPWPNVPHVSVPQQSKETVASVNAFLLNLTLDIAQDNINQVRSGNRQDITFEAQFAVIKKIAKFFNPSWK